jgi:hypothetical protein
VSGGKGVVRAFIGRREGTKSAQFAVGAEPVTPACQDLVPVGLMSYIPYYTVIGGVEDIMKGDSKFYSAQTGAEMPGILRELVYDHLSELIANLRQLLRTEFLEVVRGVNSF